jgi:hypothetical protein
MTLKMKFFLSFNFFIFFTSFSLISACEMDVNKARYDYYRLIRLNLETEDHIKLFQELEAESDSFVFYGHALSAPQKLTILVAAHK